MKGFFWRIFVALSLLSFSVGAAFASGLPFSDVKESDDYYADLKTLYERGIIQESPTGKFFPDALMNRDEFVSIVVGVTCKRCLMPTFDDILKYTTLPFVDFDRKNINFYCVSYAKEQKMVEWYVVNGSNTSTCQDGTSFNETPFCANNKITRIEAAAVLLRQAGLWNNDLNTSNFNHRETLSDVNTSWYGYAQKGLDAGILKKFADNKIRPDEYISKKEFVTMASKIFTVNLCSIKQGSGNGSGNSSNTNNSNNSGNTSSGNSNGSNASNNGNSGNGNSGGDSTHQFTAEIRILDKTASSCSKDTPVTTFPDKKETNYTFSAITEATGNLEYSWEFVRIQDGKKMTASGACLKSFALEGSGTWLVRLTIRDKDTGRTATAIATVEIRDDGAIPKNQLRWLSVTATANKLSGLVPQDIKFTGVVSGWVGPYTYRWDFSDGSFSTEISPVHTFLRSGVTPVSLTVRDSQGSTAIADLTLLFTESIDTDGDGVLNSDDRCPLVAGPKTNGWCPFVDVYQGNDFALTQTWVGGQCYFDRAKSTGAIFGAASCTSCPCAYSTEYLAEARSCDVVVPTILSPDKSAIYSRGRVFEIRF